MTELMPFIYDDAGRADCGYKGNTGDCVVRAYAIVTRTQYDTAYDLFKARMGKGNSPRNGVSKAIYKPLFALDGARWTACCAVAGKPRHHFNARDVPYGRVICRISRHLVAVIDGVIHDTYNPQGDGSRCLYGYWSFDE